MHKARLRLSVDLEQAMHLAQASVGTMEWAEVAPSVKLCHLEVNPWWSEQIGYETHYYVNMGFQWGSRYFENTDLFCFVVDYPEIEGYEELLTNWKGPVHFREVFLQEISIQKYI